MFLLLLLISIVSILSGIFSLSIRLTHRKMQFAISFVAGVMVGIAWFELIPESVELGSLQTSLSAVLRISSVHLHEPELHLAHPSLRAGAGDLGGLGVI